MSQPWKKSPFCFLTFVFEGELALQASCCASSGGACRETRPVFAVKPRGADRDTAVVTVAKGCPFLAIVCSTEEAISTLGIAVTISFTLPTRIFFSAAAVPSIALVCAAVVSIVKEPPFAVVSAASEAALAVCIAIAITFTKIMIRRVIKKKMMMFIEKRKVLGMSTFTETTWQQRTAAA